MANEKRLIDANAFKNFLEEVRQDYLEEDTFSSDFAAKVIETVQDEYLFKAPTVDAAPVVHGRWRFYGSDRWNDAYECSECGKIAMDDSNYCPNCGAKMMDGGSDNG